MLCSKCGTNNQEGVNFCINCGNPLNQNNQMNNQNQNMNYNDNYQQAPNMNYNGNYQQAPNMNYSYSYNNNKQSNGNYTASIILGVISIILALSFLGMNLIISIIGLVLGIKAKKEKGPLGMILNIIGLIIGLIIKAILVFAFILAFTVGSESEGSIVETPEYIGDYTCGITEPYNTNVDFNMTMSLDDDDNFYLGSSASNYSGSYIITAGTDYEFGSMDLYNADENDYNKYTLNLYIDKKNGETYSETLKYAMFYFSDYDALELHSLNSNRIVVCKKDNSNFQGL